MAGPLLHSHYFRWCFLMSIPVCTRSMLTLMRHARHPTSLAWLDEMRGFSISDALYCTVLHRMRTELTYDLSAKLLLYSLHVISFVQIAV